MSKMFLVNNEERVYGDNLEKRVMVVADAVGEIVDAGNLLVKNWLEYRREGYEIKEVSIEDYRKNYITENINDDENA